MLQCAVRRLGACRVAACALAPPAPVRAAPPSSPAQWSALHCSFTTQATSDNNDWRDFNNVAKALRTIATAQGWAPHSRLPDTKLLKQLGHQDLVHAIRKKHGGFGRVAEKLGVCTSANALEIHKMVASRAARRQKRHARLAKHNFH